MISYMPVLRFDVLKPFKTYNWQALWYFTWSYKKNGMFASLHKFHVINTPEGHLGEIFAPYDI